MKKTTAVLAASVIASILALSLAAQDKDQCKTVLGNGTMVINTTDLCQDVDGFMGPTPVEIRIRKDTIIDITPLHNDETPAYFREAVKVLRKWIGLTPAKGLAIEVDAVSGATFSSEALITNVHEGLKKATEH